MAERTIEVFFYGLFMDEAILVSLGATPTRPRIAIVHDYDLHIGKRATLVPASGIDVYGLLMAIPWNQVAGLYAGETLTDYRPEAVLALVTDEDPIPALCYNLPQAEDTPPNQKYAKQLLELARKLQLPNAYCERIQAYIVG